MQMIIVL